MGNFQKLLDLLRDAQGQHKLVGSSCLHDFTGIDPQAVLFLERLFEIVRMDGDYEERGLGEARVFSLCVYLAAVVFMTDMFGFVSKAKAAESGGSATADDAQGLLVGQDHELKSMFNDGFEPCLNKAKAVIDWVRSKPETASTFEHDLKLLFARDHIEIERKQLAFAAAAVAMYHRHLTWEDEKLAQKASQHVGQPGDKLEMRLQIKRINAFANKFGVVHFVVFTDSNGNMVVWKTSACPTDFHNNKDEWIRAKCTVKAHDEFKGTAQTQVQRLKLLAWEAA